MLDHCSHFIPLGLWIQSLPCSACSNPSDFLVVAVLPTLLPAKTLCSVFKGHKVKHPSTFIRPNITRPLGFLTNWSHCCMCHSCFFELKTVFQTQSDQHLTDSLLSSLICTCHRNRSPIEDLCPEVAASCNRARYDEERKSCP